MNLYDLIVAKKLSGGGGGGGGGSSYTLIHQEDIEVSTTSTSATTLKQIMLSPDDVYTDSKILYIRIRDKAGKRNGYYWGSDEYCLKKGSLIGHYLYSYYNDTVSAGGSFNPGTNSNGIWLREVSSNGKVTLYVKYNSSWSRTIDGTFSIEVYALDWPDKVSPFN